MVENTEVQAEYKETEVGLIPADWEMKRLGDEVSSLNAGVSVNSTDEAVDIFNEVGILKTSCVSSGIFDPFEVKKVLINEIHRAKCSVEKDHIVISRMNTPDLVGECGYVNFDYPNLFLPDRLWMIKLSKSSSLSPRFLNYILSFSSYKLKIKEIATGTSGSMKNISKEQLLGIKIPLPPKVEQTAIATALNDADALITQLEKLIAKKRAIKQGAMQELLKPKEGWEVKRLGDEIDFQGGSQPPLTTFISKEKEGYIRLIQIRDYKTDSYKTYIPLNLSKRFCKKDDIMIGRYGPPVFQILRGIEGSYNVALMKAVPSKNVFREYAYHYLKQDSLFWFVETLSKRTAGQSGIDMKELKAYPFPVPPYEEQIMIAQTLSDMDTEIESLEKKLAKYQLVKQGMMQNLLTGKIRL